MMSTVLGKSKFTAKAVFISMLLFVASCSGSDNGGNTSRLDQIVERGSIRCSYLNYEPYFMTDPNSGEHSGIFFDIMEEIGDRSELDIEWTEEVGYEVIFTGLDSGRHDVFCGGLWSNASRAKSGYFSEPIFYSVIKAWVRAEDDRFDDMSLEQLNSPNIRIATIDGAMEDIIARTQFPSAQQESLPQLSPFTQNLQNIVANKADITFAEPGTIYEFLESNPGTLKDPFPDQAFRVFGNSLVSPIGDEPLASFLDASMKDLLYSGYVDTVLQKYEPAPGVFPRAQLPYQLETAILQLTVPAE